MKNFNKFVSLSFLAFIFLFSMRNQLIAENSKKYSFRDKLLEVTDPSDKELVDDILMDYHDLVQKYASNIDYNLDNIESLYAGMDDLYEKVAFLSFIRKQDMKDKRVLEVLFHSLLDGIYNYDHNNLEINISKYWKVRAFASRIVMERISDFDKDGLRKVLYALKNLVNYDKENRSRSLALICLATVAKNSQSKFSKEEYENTLYQVEHMFFRMLNNMEDAFHRVNPKKYYLYLSLVKGFGIIESKKSVFKLLKIMSLFNYKIKYEIIRTVKKISKK